MMLVPEGTKASTQEVRARWAYGEMTSARFGPKYRNHGVKQAILDCAVNHAAFDDVDRSHWPELDRLLGLARPGEYLHGDLNQWSLFKCSHWTKTELENALAIRAFNKPNPDPLPYIDFYKGLPNTGANQRAEDSDPRVQAFRTPDYPQAEPAVAQLVNGKNLLVDGYLRSIIFMRQDKPELRFAVWVPVP
jgi:hypothetical protein